MAVRNLVEGQCGESNPLMRLTHHLTSDKALADEGLQWSSHAFQDGSKSGLVYGSGSAVEQLVEEFMSETQQAVTPAPQPFRMDALLQEMREIESSRGPPLLGPAIADLASQQPDGAWAEEFLAAEAQSQHIGGVEWEGYESESSRHHIGLTSPDDVLAPADTRMGPPSYYPHHALPYPHTMDPMHHRPEPLPLGWADGHGPSPHHLQYHLPQPLQHQHYDPRHDSELAQTANELLGTVDDPKFSNTEFMQFIRKLSEETDQLSSTATRTEQQRSEGRTSQEPKSGASSVAAERGRQARAEAQSSSSAWTDQVSSSRTDDKADLHQRWAQEFKTAQAKGSLDDVDVDSSDLSPSAREHFWERLQERWEELAQHDDLDSHAWLTDYETATSEPLKPYQFLEDNPLSSHPDPLSEGERCLAAGDLPSAVLLFEAAAQQQPDLAKAWFLLGLTHAENEQDARGIPALRRCVELEPVHSQAWMALATSYTNESYQTLACSALKEWLRSKSEYRALTGGAAKEETTQPKLLAATLAPKALVDEVQSLYLSAANARGGAVEGVDPDVQCGLGVLYNLIGDYSKAVDCFQAALSVTPEDARLWNKLGATLANSSRSEEAVAAYENALDLSPGFIRCRYNLGIACINLNAHREAAGHFLSALNLQAAGRGLSQQSSKAAMSDNIWTTMRVCLPAAGFAHLLTAVDKRDLTTLNAELETGTAS